MAQQVSSSYAGNPSSVKIASGKYTSSVISLNITQLSDNATVTKIVISFTTTAAIMLCDSSSTNHASYSSAGAYDYTMESSWKDIGDSSWRNSGTDHYPLSIRFRRNTTSGSVTVSDVRYSVYYTTPETKDGFVVIPAVYSETYPTLYESGYINLSWDDSEASYYRWGYAVSADGETYGDETLSGNLTACSAYVTLSLTQFPRGYTARFHLYSYDSGGASYTYKTVCYLVRNVVSDAPALVYPKSKVHSSKPVMIISVGAAPNKLSRDLHIVTGSIEQIVQNIGAGATQITVAMSNSLASTNLMYIKDEIGGSSNTTAIEIKHASPSWSRTIESGTVIADTLISHRADLNEMLAAANVSRSAYGLSSASFSADIGYFANWITNMQDIYNAIVQVYEMLGKSYSDFPGYTNSYPQADVVNCVRQLIEGV